ncbi:hypothetical protein IMG5_123150 [Ichthyophthirius multifiliis]|uniref:Uncharacterized protein n=1 Tax=Ichthyophthirius multifiliis TaxID=5932 RepID=G0QVE4_ICHMU|nr:hypothetical protein IMG5_123150 [Ichthyophthirius multifiliis]EGR30801.1 hypothetical protein IMG5_123150 [Ichthyophthirius multifiliis]|eukprot:XP_004032388.1 hypothetical protein IMG5_123150 [Ichthyophthirius multifiliis]
MFKNKLLEIGASLTRSASGYTNKFAGDGTTTTIILANSILEEGQKYVNFDINPIEMKKGMDIGKKHILEYLEEISIKVNTKDQLNKVAMVCTNHDQKMSKLISDALIEVGLDGIIEIEPGNQLVNELSFTKGITLSRGYASRELIINKQSNSVELNYPLILIADLEIKQIREIVPALELAKKFNKSLLIFAKDISNDVLSSIIFNQQKKIINCCAITVPGMGNYSRVLLEGIALLTGATLFENLNYELFQEIQQKDFGKCQEVLVSELETFFQGTQGPQDKINQRVEELRKSIKNSDNETSQKILKERLARFTGKMAIILCGGNTELDIYENRDRLVDGLNGVKNAIKYGIVTGGGTCLLKASQLLDYIEVENFEQKCGLNALKTALLKPTQILLDNAGFNGKYIVQKILEKQQDDPYIDMI